MCFSLRPKYRIPPVDRCTQQLFVFSSSEHYPQLTHSEALDRYGRPLRFPPAAAFPYQSRRDIFPPPRPWVGRGGGVAVLATGLGHSTTPRAHHRLHTRSATPLPRPSECTDSADCSGNPGLLNYYHPFLAHLHYLLPASHAILSTSHIGHSPHLPAPQQPLDLHQQLTAKVELINSLRRYIDQWANEGYRNPRGRVEHVDRPRISLMGHSVGSWFLLEAMKLLGDSIEAGYMLFPTLGWIADSWNGRKLWVSFQYHASCWRIMGELTSVAHISPSSEADTTLHNLSLPPHPLTDDLPTYHPLPPPLTDNSRALPPSLQIRDGPHPRPRFDVHPEYVQPKDPRRAGAVWYLGGR